MDIEENRIIAAMGSGCGPVKRQDLTGQHTGRRKRLHTALNEKNILTT